MPYEPIHTEKFATNLHGGPFQPLPSGIATLDTFSEGMEGWRQLNEEGFATDGMTELSTLPEKGYGNVGGVTGDTVLKLSTQSTDSNLRSLKRITQPWFGADVDGNVGDAKVRFETVYTYHTGWGGSEEDVINWSFELDTQQWDSDGQRWWPRIRYRNFDTDGNPMKYWDINTGGPESPNYEKITGSDQRLTDNFEGPERKKPSWHYFRMDVDLENLQYVEMQSNGLVMDLSGISTSTQSGIDDLYSLMNPIVQIKNNNERVIFALDSVCVSYEVSNDA